MKKFFALAAMAALLVGFASCTKTQTELSSDTIQTKVNVYGNVTYDTYNATGSKTECKYEGPVDVFYRKSGSSDALTHKVVNADDEGYFELQLGCPAGQSLEVKAQAATTDDTRVTVNGAGVVVSAYYFGQASKTVTSGSAAYIKVVLNPVAYPETPDAN